MVPHRIFLGVGLPDAQRAQVASELLRLRRKHPRHHWVRSENLHLTCAFVGSVSSLRLSPLIRAAQRSLTGVPPFSLRIAGSGGFPSRDDARVWWLGVEAAGAEYFEEVCARLAEALGTKIQQTPHLTLGRARKNTSFPPIPPSELALAPFVVSHVNVYETVLSKAGTTYVVRHAIPLGRKSRRRSRGVS